jgi:hypothetical protein
VGQYFQAAVSQSHHSGNPDIKWDKGVVITSHYEDLWKPTLACGPEDIRHFQSRVEEFDALVPFLGEKKDAPMCKQTFCTWLVTASAAWATGSPAPPPADAPELGDEGAMEGMTAFVAKAKVPAEMVGRLAKDIADLGAVAVSELDAADWRSWETWPFLRTFEQRFILKAL